MGYLIWELLCFLFSFLGNSVMAFMTSQPFHHISQSARVVPLYLLLSLLECLEDLRHCLTRATRMVHRPPPSTSRLLLLPAEIRQQIWTLLLEDIVDLEDIEFISFRDMGPRVYRYADRLRLFTDINPRYSTRWELLANTLRCRLQWPPAFMQSCSQIYYEAGYDFCNELCSNKKFAFFDSRAIISGIRTLTPAQKGAIGQIYMIMSNEVFNNPGIAPAMSQLSGLRKLHLWYSTEDEVSLYTSDVQAHIVWQLVRNVRVSEQLMVTSAEENGATDYNWRRKRWASYHQGLFARAVEARIRRPLSNVQHHWPIPRGAGPQNPEFVLRYKRFY